jgi:hypothetical protein
MERKRGLRRMREKKNRGEKNRGVNMAYVTIVIKKIKK